MAHLSYRKIPELVVMSWLLAEIPIFVGYYIFFTLLPSINIFIILLFPYLLFSTYMVRYVLLRYSCWKIRRIKRKYGKLNYVTSKKPYSWHEKMHYLRIVELLTLKEERVKFYRLCNGNIGSSVVCDGSVSDPDLVEIGDQTIIGTDSLIISHSIEGDNIILSRVKIGRNCTIGARTIIMPGCEIGDNVIIGCNSVVPKNSKMPPNSIWAGTPARKVRKNDPI